MAHVGNANAGGKNEAKPTTFHDFLGDKGPGQASAPAVVDGGLRPTEASPSSTSDLGSERNPGDHLEGIPYHGSRFTGYKRSNSDSFTMSSRDKFPQDSPLLTKLLRYSGGEWPRRSSRDEETSFGRTNNNNNNNNNSNNNNSPLKWDRVLQYPQPNRFKEANVGPPLVSQTAADEGSRTGIKGSSILSSINASGIVSGRQPSGVLIRSRKQKSGINIFEPESSTVLSPPGTRASGQMTIFYGGQAHVFDNVNPNKADVIMTLAGSNGGSWSTTLKK